MDVSLDRVLAHLCFLGRSKDVARLRLGVIVALDRYAARKQRGERRL